MFGLGTQELIIILVLVLIIFGAGKLPQVGSALGKGLRNFKSGIKDDEDENSDKTGRLENGDKDKKD
jgi:sec-independent protein translocase protein TatA